MPTKAIQLYSSASNFFEDPDRLILAEAYLALGKPVRASKQLNGLKSAPPPLLLARISEMQSDFIGAAQVFEALDLSDEYESSIWRAGDWQAVEQSGIEARVNVAQIILASSQAETHNSGALITDFENENFSTSSDNALDPISASRKLLEQSNATRRAIADLLKTR